MLSAAGCLFLIVLLLACQSDLRLRWISDAFPAFLAAAGLLFTALTGGWPFLGYTLAGALAVFLLGLLAFRYGILGGADVKLLSAAALWLQPAQLLVFLQVTALAGGVLALVYLLLARLRGESAGSVKLPYAVAIAAGGLAVTPSLAGWL
ncbi:A24 family peptidase [Aquibaculum sediminis]|uniref:A24 family peptidase n=1 Tax=Aquibaculum sediminis TaxID=3231907 RepID=UPI003456F574